MRVPLVSGATGHGCRIGHSLRRKSQAIEFALALHLQSRTTIHGDIPHRFVLISRLIKSETKISKVLVKFTAGATQSQKQAWKEGITGLKSTIPQVKELLSGEKLPHVKDGGYDDGNATTNSLSCIASRAKASNELSFV